MQEIVAQKNAAQKEKLQLNNELNALHLKMREMESNMNSQPKSLNAGALGAGSSQQQAKINQQD